MSKIIEGVLAFAMAHPVATTIIAVAAIAVYGAVQISKNCSNNKIDEDRNVGNRKGNVRQN